MKFNTNRILEIGNGIISEFNFTSNIDYDWLDIVGIHQRPKILKQPLFFATYSDGKDGWHNPFDRRKYIQKVIDERRWHVVIDDSIIVNGDFLKISSMDKFTERIYSYSRNNTNPYVVGVTGSVGKTTTVAFLEHLLNSSGYKAIRFFSTRLTPLLTQTSYINRIFSETDFVLMEYGAFLPDQVGILSELLPPNLAFISNILNQHIRYDLFSNKFEILDSKLKIKSNNGLGYINNYVLNELKLDIPFGWDVFTPETDFKLSNALLPPTLRTAELYTIGKKVAEIIGISQDKFQESFSDFVPKENRVATLTFKIGSLFFDREAPHASRLWSWFEVIKGTPPILFVDTIDFGNDDINTYIGLLTLILGSENTYVLDNIQNRNMIPVKANYFNKRDFGEKLINHMEKKFYIVYHKTVKNCPEFNSRKYMEDTWGLH